MANLQGKAIKDTYEGLIKTENNSEVSGNTTLTDGAGNSLGITVNTSGDVVANSVTAGNLNISNWNESYSWGDHSTQGYVTSTQSIEFFQVQDDGVTGQATSGTTSTLQGLWDTPTLLSSSAFSFDGSTGLLTVLKAGVIEFDIKLTSYQTLGNRHELRVEIQRNSSQVIMTDSQYASRDSINNTGSSYINGFKFSSSANDTYRLRVKDVGVEATIGASQVAGMSYFSAKLYT